MDPAEFDKVKTAVGNQGQRIGEMQATLQSLINEVSKISTHLTTTSTAPPQPPQPPGPVSAPVPLAAEPRIPPPAKYSGNPNTCREFLTQVKLTFDAQPARFAHEVSKVAFIASLLEGPPLSYFNALHEQDSPTARSFDLFAAELKRIYDHPIRGQQAGQHLLKLRQGRRSVREFTSEFRSLAVESGWNDQALLTAFLSGLNRTVGREIALRGDQNSLDEAISTAIKISDQMAQWQAEPFPSRSSTSSAWQAEPFPSRSATSSAGVRGNSGYLPDEPRHPVPQVLSSGPPDEEPMQLGRTRLSTDERLRRVNSGACLYCGQLGHFRSTCPLRPKEGARQ